MIGARKTRPPIGSWLHISLYHLSCSYLICELEECILSPATNFRPGPALSGNSFSGSLLPLATDFGFGPAYSGSLLFPATDFGSGLVFSKILFSGNLLSPAFVFGSGLDFFQPPIWGLALHSRGI